MNGSWTTDVDGTVKGTTSLDEKPIPGDTNQHENPKAVRFSYAQPNCGCPEGARSRVRSTRTSIRSKLTSLQMLLSDWIFLAVLGILVAFLSISVDMMIYYFQEVQSMTFLQGERFTQLPVFTFLLSFASWCAYTTGMVAASAAFVHYVSPQAIGSGIPEMKTIIRGVILKDYLTTRTLLSKVFGVAMSLGSGVPIGKMGPFVHIASAVANQLSRLASHFDPAFKSETRRAECLAAACAVGVACTFSAPVGGVLFSIEVTTMYFSVRSYWRGFFAACCGAITIRLLRGFVAQTEVTVNAFFQTSFAPDAFVVNEIPLFVLLGIVCGVSGAMYISLYRTVVLFLRSNDYAKKVFQQHWIVYPIFVSLAFSITSFPHGLGRFSTGRLRFGMNLKDFFSNCTFSEPKTSFLSCKADIYDHWLNNRENILVLLTLFVAVHFVFSIICLTLPIPSGLFMPIFVLGAAIGRLMGEIVAIALPLGLIDGLNIYPGVYAVVGAASFSASVTHTVSVSVMIFEITGQLHYILPVMISVLLSNAVCAYMQPSFFDTIIKIKHLPFLPDIPPSNHIVHTVCAEDIMVSPVLFLTRVTTYGEIEELLADRRNLRIFPVVDSKVSQTLIGTISRNYLTELLELQIGDVARREEAERRVRNAIVTIDVHFQTSKQQMTESHRTKSESSLTPLTPRTPQSIRKQTTEEQNDASERRTSRFVVSAGKIEPSTTNQSSPKRRNAFCSLETHSNGEEEEREDTKSVISNEEHTEKHHLSLHNITDYHTLVKSYMRQAKKYLHYMQFGYSRQEKQPVSMYDLSNEEKKEWEAARLSDEVDLTADLDPAPFQLVKKTSLFKIHSIFSMLQLSKVYVTEAGRLIGVVSLSDVRHELERSQDKTCRDTSRAHQGDSDQSQSACIHKTPSTSAVFDILTPTLEVIKSTTLALTANHDDIESRPQSPQSNLSAQSPRKTFAALATSPTDDGRVKVGRIEGRQRLSLDDPPHEELVEAVAYLRRKSMAPMRKNIGPK
ncbi:hypothetical protein Q1695_001638 [Nippostrongylus brasiliensis]|nr:hypothetical protein Q1695_001638 [Nippostrongylus brasiliensis]